MDELSSKTIKRLVWAGSIIIAIIILLFASVRVVRAGERGVLMTFGAVSERVLDEGVHFKIPFVQKIKKMNVRTQKEEKLADAASLDLQDVQLTVAINYRADAKKVNKLYQKIGDEEEYVGKIIMPALQEGVKSVTAKFTATELITKRDEVNKEIKEAVKSRIETDFIEVEQVRLVNFQFSEQFDLAIEAKVTAVQEAEAEKNRLEKVKYQSDQKIEAARGKSEAIRIEASALQANPDILELRRIENEYESIKKWNGVMPLYTGGAIPFIDIKS